MTKRAITTFTMVLCIAGLVAAPARAAEETQTHLFNAALTLTGDCSTTLFDPVPDPGLCPMPPGVAGVDHPSTPFKEAGAIAVDAYGNRYVGSRGNSRVDIFDSSGEFISSLSITGLGQFGRLSQLAIDSKGNLYATVTTDTFPFGGVKRYPPTVYEPQTGNILYEEEPVTLEGEDSNGNIGPIDGGESAPAVNPLNDHLFIPGGPVVPTSGGGFVKEYSSAAEGNTLLDTFGTGDLTTSRGVAIDAKHGRIYATTYISKGGKNIPAVKVFELDPPHALLGTIDGAETPPGRFTADSVEGIGVAAEEATGHLFVSDLGVATPRVFEFGADFGYLGQVKGPAAFKFIDAAQIAVDNGPDSPTKGYLFVPSSENPPARSMAFEPIPIPTPPAVDSLSLTGIAEEEAVLHADVNPSGEASSYRIELTTQQAFEEAGESFGGATVLAEGDLTAGNEAVAVSAAALGLEPGTAYRFRVVAKNESGEDEAEAPFSTYAPGDPSSDCANEALRTGASAALPDCRAYELVTPADTGGRSPHGHGIWSGLYFPTLEASPQGDRVSFVIEGGIVPGLGGTGGKNGDPYLATRGATGWSGASAGPDGVESPEPILGSVSADQGFSFWGTDRGIGSAAIDDKRTFYVRYPDGHSELIGRGALGNDPGAEGRLITEGGGHIVFDTKDAFRASPPQQLEPNAPPNGTVAIYDRTADEVTHVVSLLPGEVTPAVGQNAGYTGASPDGEGIAFSVGGTLYLRVGNEETYEIATGAEFAGVAEGGKRIFYVEGGNLLAFDATTEETIEFSTTGDVIPVNVAKEGTRAYFVSPSVLGGANPEGATAQAGKENLYLSEEGAVEFVATVTDADVGSPEGEGISHGLGGWTTALENIFPANDTSRSTRDGKVLVFESSASLTGEGTGGHHQIYRYDATAGELQCLSCSPTQTTPGADAVLQSTSLGVGDSESRLGNVGFLENVRDDGRRVFFQSPEPLVLADTDGLLDVYEWEEDGVGSCHTPGGCVYLISSPNSARDEYLYGVSRGGDDVFFGTSDLLLPASDPDETPSIYDARVNGGFPPPNANAGECLGEACQPGAVAPEDPTPASSTFQGAGNVRAEGKEAKPRCARGKKAVRRSAKVRCVAKKHKHNKSNHKRANANGRAGR